MTGSKAVSHGCWLTVLNEAWNLEKPLWGKKSTELQDTISIQNISFEWQFGLLNVCVNIFACIFKTLTITKQEFSNNNYFIDGLIRAWYFSLFNVNASPQQNIRVLNAYWFRRWQVSGGAFWQWLLSYSHLLSDSLTFWDSYLSQRCWRDAALWFQI